MSYTQKGWVDFLTERAKSEGVAVHLTPAEIHGWTGGVSAGDDPENVWAAFMETLNESGKTAK